MGARLGRTYVLSWEEGTYLGDIGAEITMRSAPIGVVLDIETKPMSELIGVFARYVSSWNLEDADGRPVPMTSDGVLHAFERPVIQAVMQAWYEAAMGISAPLDPPSGDGEASPDGELVELSIPMDVAS